MRSNRARTFLLGLFVVAGVVAYGAPAGDPAPTPEHPRDSGKPVEGMVLSVSFGKESYDWCDRIVLYIREKNVSAQDMDIFNDGLLTTYKFNLTMPGGKAAPLTVCGRHLVEFAARRSDQGGTTLKPGESQVTIVGLNKYFDMTELGDYTVQVERSIFKKNAERRELVRITSNEASSPLNKLEFHAAA